MLTQSDVVKVAKDYFPNNFGIIITGSQQQNEVLKKETDIDVVILDKPSVAQWNVIMEKDGYKIEFIVLPVTDLENVLDNGRHEPKNGLLMLAQGKILFDPFGVMQPMQQKVKTLFNTVQFNTGYEYRRFLIELMKLPDLIKLSLTDVEKAIVLSDFVHIISILETIRVTKWSSRTKHKLRHLKTHSPTFLENLFALYQKGIVGEFDEIIAYIKFYEKNFATSHLSPKNKYNKLIVDIGFSNFSITTFICDILPQILMPKSAIDSYLYFYLSPKKYNYKYRYNISLAFQINGEDKYLALLSIIDKSIDEIKSREIYFNNFCEEEKPVPQIDKLNSIISKLIVNETKERNDFDREKMVNFFFSLCFYLKNSFGISNGDFQKINLFIAEKWSLSNLEQAEANGYPMMMKFKSLRYNKAEIYYNSVIPKLLQLVLINNETIANNETSLVGLFAILDNITKETAKFSIPENDIIEAIFKAMEFTDIKAIWLYKMIVEELLQVLNINDSDKFNALYSCSKASSEMGCQVQKPQMN